jgi:arylsulfatase A-like enzyme
VRVDENIGRIVEGVKKAGMWDDTVFMLVADHGGEGTKHGLANLNCFEIPFVVSGAPVKGKRLVEPVLLADTAPTILSILGYEVPDAMRGRYALR